MVKIVFLADTHLGFDFPLKPRKEKRRRGPDFFNNFDEVLAYVNKVKPDLVIHGGDLFYRTLVPQPIVDMVYERIFTIAESGIPFVIVPGNHESSRLPISLFLHHPNIYYFTKPQIFKFQLNNIAIDVAGFPCVRKKVMDKFPEIAEQIEKDLRPNSIKLLCMHQAISGAKVGPSDYTFRHGKDVVPINDIPSNYNLILSGHIHRMQILKTKNNTPVIYPGSIERTAFAEKDEDKGFYEIVVRNDEDIACNFIQLPARPMIDIFLEKENYSLALLKEDILKHIGHLPDDSIVRFKMKNPSNLSLLSSTFLDKIVPPTMNYQIAGMSEFFGKGDRKSKRN